MLPDGGVAMIAGQPVVEFSLDVEAVAEAPVFGEVGPFVTFVPQDLRVALRAGQYRPARDYQLIIFGFPRPGLPVQLPQPVVQDMSVPVVTKPALPALGGGVEVVDDDAFAGLLPVLQQQDDRSRVGVDPRPELHGLDAEPRCRLSGPRWQTSCQPASGSCSLCSSST